MAAKQASCLRLNCVHEQRTDQLRFHAHFYSPVFDLAISVIKLQLLHF